MTVVVLKLQRKKLEEIDGVTLIWLPIAHIWYFRSLPNKIGYFRLTFKKLDMIIYYEKYGYSTRYCKGPDGETLNTLDFLTEEEYLNIMILYQWKINI